MVIIESMRLDNFWDALWAIALGAMRLDPSAFAAADALQKGGLLALLILLLGGLSSTIGQSAILLANRVGRRRFLFSLLIATLVLAVSVVIWSASIWLTATFFFRTHRPFVNLLRLVSLSYAPMILGFLALLPYFGSLVLRALRFWVLCATLVAVSAIYQFSLIQAVVCCGLGWLTLQMAARLPIIRAHRLYDLAWRLATGKRKQMGVEMLADQFVEQVRVWHGPHDDYVPNPGRTATRLHHLRSG